MDSEVAPDSATRRARVARRGYADADPAYFASRGHGPPCSGPALLLVEAVQCSVDLSARPVPAELKTPIDARRLHIAGGVVALQPDVVGDDVVVERLLAWHSDLRDAGRA